MPYKRKRPCSILSCPNLIAVGKYCEVHRQNQAEESTRKNTSERHRHENTRRWQKVRMMYLRNYPLCVECGKQNKINPASEVHHIVPVTHGGEDTETNLEPLCKSCHSKKTASERKAYGGIKSL